MTFRTGLFVVLAMSLLGGCEREHAATPVEAHTEPAGNGDAPEKPEKTEPTAEADNPVRHEMQLLTVAMKNSLDAIANNQVHLIPAEISKVHPAKMKTEAALKAGTYKTPYNADQMDDFVKKDEVFHGQLRALLGAAKANDTKAAAAAYGDLVQGCADCHAVYRFPPE